MIEPASVGTLTDGEWCWFDVVDPTAVDLSTLQTGLGLHPLAVEDAQHRQQRPKVELYADHAFVVVRPLTVAASGDVAETEIHAFVSHRWLVTLRFTPVYDSRGRSGGQGSAAGGWGRTHSTFRRTSSAYVVMSCASGGSPCLYARRSTCCTRSCGS